MEDRVSSSHLSDTTPTSSLKDFDLSSCLPDVEIQTQMRREFIVLGSRILTKHLSAFKPLSSVVVHHMPHEYTEAMSEASTSVSSNTPIIVHVE